LDHLGYETVGVGHLIQSGDAEHGKGEGFQITKTRSDELLFQDLNICLSECEHHLERWEHYSEEVKLIIANMAFNLGITKLKKFKMMFLAIDSGDYVRASEEGLDSKWAKQVYNRAKRLMNRLRDADIED
tara:strand:+ start:875 stop:1264 length:390 start_codon:yes stop_codon:yes gene_type:complete